MFSKNVSRKIALVAAVTLFNSGLALATETNAEKAKNEVKDVWKDTKQEARKAKAEIQCRTNDKKCLEAKAKAKAKNAADEVEQKSNEVIDKVD